MVARMEALNSKSCENPGSVLPGCNSQNQGKLGVHWYRSSCHYKYLQQIVTFLSTFFGESQCDGYGLWSYDARYSWASGVSLNFDTDRDRGRIVHKNRVTIDCPGGSLEILTPQDVQLLIDGIESLFEGQCSRIDTYFDDYTRQVQPKDLHKLIEDNDFSGFRSGKIVQEYKGGKLVHDEVDFGRRGSNGSGKYMRFYDKELETYGELKCNRFEVEWTGKKAAEIAKKLASTGGDVAAFCTLCGALVGGSIVFVKRTHDKNVKRLDWHEFWTEIVDIIGVSTIRVAKKVNTLIGTREYVRVQAMPSLACMRKTFTSDRVFFDWLYDMLEDGEHRLNPNHENIVRKYAGSVHYRRQVCKDRQEADYVSAMA